MSTEYFEIRIRIIVDVESRKLEPKKTPGPNFSGITVVEQETSDDIGANSDKSMSGF